MEGWKFNERTNLRMGVAMCCFNVWMKDSQQSMLTWEESQNNEVAEVSPNMNKLVQLLYTEQLKHSQPLFYN